jgi:hypothetical protein
LITPNSLKLSREHIATVPLYKYEMLARTEKMWRQGLALATIYNNTGMIVQSINKEFARVSTNISTIRKYKSIAQKIGKNSLEIQQPLCHMYTLHGEDEDRKAYTCYLRKFRDVSYIATLMWRDRRDAIHP